MHFAPGIRGMRSRSCRVSVRRRRELSSFESRWIRQELGLVSFSLFGSQMDRPQKVSSEGLTISPWNLPDPVGMSEIAYSANSEGLFLARKSDIYSCQDVSDLQRFTGNSCAARLGSHFLQASAERNGTFSSIALRKAAVKLGDRSCRNSRSGSGE